MSGGAGYNDLIQYLYDVDDWFPEPEPTVELDLFQSCADDEHKVIGYDDSPHSGFVYDVFAVFTNTDCIDTVDFRVVEDRLPANLGSFEFSIDNPVSADAVPEGGIGGASNGSYVHWVAEDTDSAILAVLFTTFVVHCD